MMVNIHIVTWRQKAGITKSEKTFIARQLFSKHIPAAMNTQATIDYLPSLSNDAVNTPSQQYRDCFLRGPREVIKEEFS
jgi:hypothetical protein